MARTPLSYKTNTNEDTRGQSLSARGLEDGFRIKQPLLASLIITLHTMCVYVCVCVSTVRVCETDVETVFSA